MSLGQELVRKIGLRGGEKKTFAEKDHFTLYFVILKKDHFTLYFVILE